MKPTREEALLAAAMERPATERAAFLDGACLGDAALRERVKALLAAHEQPATELARADASTVKTDEVIHDIDEAVGQTLGRYKLLEKLGEGGCGVVYVAEQTEPVRRRVALKVIKLGMATNRLSSPVDWKNAMGVAINLGDRAAEERLIPICWLRFCSTVEGNAAGEVLVGLYLQPMDERTLRMARVLMDRVDDGSIGTGLHGNYVNAMVTFREHRYPEALRLVDQFLDTPSSRPGSGCLKQPPYQAIALALRAMVGAELGSTEEACRDLARSLAQLKLALGDKPGHDRGDVCFQVDQAEIHLRKAKAVCQAKGIPLPEPDAS